jgi:subtilisin family serine protease
MLHGKLKLLSFLFIFLIITIFVNSSPQYSKVDNNIYNQLENNDEITVIVNLKEDSNLATPRKISRAFSTQSIKNYKEKYHYSLTNSYALKVNQQQLEELKNNPNVKYIHENKVYHKSLLDTLPLTNISQIHSKVLNNQNLTGQDQTICILDSGIDFTHSAFGNCTNLQSENCRIISGYDFVNSDDDPSDDEGHGTHVAGIASASSTITGAAPSSKILAVKVLNSMGKGDADNINAGIEYCIDKSEEYNVTVISMSLGNGADNSDYCDIDPLKASIDLALSKNISVVIASGNEGHHTGISSPACIRNVTSVGSINKDLTIPSYSNRNKNLITFAPGTSIYSTWLNNQFKTDSGTSMSAPLVAGAITLLKQYKLLESSTILTPSEINSALKDNGNSITDYTGLNYSILHALNSLVSLDNLSPILNLEISKSDIQILKDNTTINFTADDLNLNYTFLNITNPSGNLFLESNSNITLFNYNFSDLGEYKINLYAYDKNNNFNSTSFTFYVYNNTPLVRLISPNNKTYTSNKNLTLICTSYDTQQLANATLEIINSSMSYIYSPTINITGTTNKTSFNVTLDHEGSYEWNCLIFNNRSNSSFASENNQIILDTIIPSVSLISPTNNSAATSTSIDFSFISTDDNLANCSLYIDNTLKQTNSVTSSLLTTFTQDSLTTSSYNWHISCTDLANNINDSETRTFSLSIPVVNNGGSPGGGGGGGSGGGSSSSKSSSSNNEDSNDDEDAPDKPIIKTNEVDYDKNPKISSNINEIQDVLPSVTTHTLSSIKRKIKVENQQSILTLELETNQTNFYIYDEIPKEFAEDASLITIESNAEVTIIKQDPTFLLKFTNSSGKEEINYKVNKEVPTFIVNSVKEPSLVLEEIKEVQIEESFFDKFWSTITTAAVIENNVTSKDALIYLIAIISIILIILFRNKITSFIKRD